MDTTELLTFRQAAVDDLIELVDAADAVLTDEQQTRHDTLMAWIEDTDTLIERQSRVNALAAATPDVAPRVTRTELGHDPSSTGSALISNGADPVNINLNRSSDTASDFERLTTRGSLTTIQMRDAAKAQLERLNNEFGVDVDFADSLVSRGSVQGAQFAEHMAVFGHETYHKGWAKMMTGRQWDLTDAEKRAMNVGTATSGGSIVPTHLDPTVILTNAGVQSQIAQISRTVTLPSPGPNTWNGLTSAGVTASWGAEASAYTEGSPTIQPPSIPTEKLMLHTKVSEEALEDIAGLGTMVLDMFGDAQARAEGAAFINGSGAGSNEPQGIITALTANTQVEIEGTTAHTLGLVDLKAALNGVAPRFQDRSTWLMSNEILGTIQGLGTAVSASFSTDITQNYANQLLGAPVALASDMPGTPATTTTVENWLIFGDFSNFTIVRKIGMRIQFYPVAVNASGVPTGESGWLGHTRVGSEPVYSGDSTSTRAFVLLQDGTSA